MGIFLEEDDIDAAERTMDLLKDKVNPQVLLLPCK
jgi:hypothetical protein